MTVFRAFSCKTCDVQSETEGFTDHAIIVSCPKCEVSELHEIDSKEMEHFTVEDFPIPRVKA